MAVIVLEKLYNTRDLGGAHGAGGRIVRSGRLIRSGELFRASEKDLDLLKTRWALTDIADFRCAAERRQAPDPVLAGVKVHWFPVLPEETLGITHADSGRDPLNSMKEMMRSGTFQAEAYMAGLYRAMMQSESALAAYRDFFDLLLTGPQTLLWHCSAGKDRAGIAAALVLCALGVSRQEIMEDYLLTNRCTALQAEKAGRALFPADAAMQAAYCTIMQVSPAYLEAVFAEMDRCGGTDAFLETRLHLNQAKRARLQALYLSEGGI